MVPVEPTEAMLYHCASATPRKDYKDMLRFAPKDLSAVTVKVPERKVRDEGETDYGRKWKRVYRDGGRAVKCIVAPKG